LLFEKGIKTQDTSCIFFKLHKAIFPTPGVLPFDIFAAAFYLISRYEEYLPHETDEYGRFAHSNALAYRENFLHVPLVNIWLQEFKRLLAARFPGLAFRRNQFSNVITYDVDIAYSYLDKGVLRNLGGTVRSIRAGDWNSVVRRWKVLLGKKNDPFDCFEWLDALHLYCRLKPYYFFLVSAKNSKYDKNVPTSSKRLRELIEYYAGTYNVGIHPSWQSGDQPGLMKEELEWLEVVAGKKIVASRQHYIRMTLPGTYRQLIANHVNKDFSMGYGSINGFRASVCSGFAWYDLEREEETSLIIHPFCYMDANAYFEEKLTPQQAYGELIKFYNEVKKVNGMLITIWHNHLLGAAPGMEAWAEMFELFMRDTVYWDAYNDGGALLSDEFLFSSVLS